MKAGIDRELKKLLKAHMSSAYTKSETVLSRSKMEKRRVVDEVKGYLSAYRTLALLDATGMPARFGVYIRRRLEGIGVVKMIKGRLLQLAMKELNLKNVDSLSKYLTGQQIAVFTNLNCFEIALTLSKISMPVKARIGEKIDSEIRVPPMKTDLRPGPIMSLFGKLKVPIQVRDGVIWIAREAVIARPGDVVTPELASVFDRLGIEPKFVKPVIKAVYEDGLVLSSNELVVDVESVRRDMGRGIADAFNLASELALPYPDVIKISIAKAYNRALRLAAESVFISRETVQPIFSLALSRALAIASILSQRVPELAQQLPTAASATQPTTQQPQQEIVKAEEEEKKEVSEEELAEGLAALFG